MLYIESLATFFYYTGVAVEYLGLVFIIVFLAIALFRLPTKKYTIQSVRASLARKIMFALEIIIAGDILLATVATDLGDILKLGGIVVIRVVLGYALREEVMDWQIFLFVVQFCGLQITGL